MRSLELKFPPALLFILLAAASYGYGVWQQARLLPIMTGLAWIGVVLMGLGIVCCVAGVVSFRRARTTVNPLAPERATKLVIRGIYHYSRNPMYLGFALMLIGTGLLWQQLSIVVWTWLFMAYLQRFQIKPEERALTALFGADYQHYCQQVRRWC